MKPRLKRLGPDAWTCRTDNCSGYAPTAAEAFEAWMQGRRLIDQECGASSVFMLGASVPLPLQIGGRDAHEGT